MDKKKAIGLSSFKKNSENPFIEQAIEEINKNLVKKYRNSTGTSRGAILTAIDRDGQVVGHTSFVKQIEVDEDQFAKLYLSQFSAFFELKQQAIKVFGYIMTRLQPSKDMFIFLIEDCMKYTGYANERSIYIGLTSLVSNEIIARGPSDVLFFINPMVCFNGNRLTFAKTYVKKKKGTIDPKQTALFN